MSETIKTSPPRISIIIPISTFDKFLEECLGHCRALDYPDYEIILLPDEMPEEDVPGITIIPTGNADPSTKRNTGVANATGEICAFIDADAYPKTDWLMKAAAWFTDPEVAAVGGPNLTPPGEEPMKQANSIIFSSLMGGRRYTVRYTKPKVMTSFELQTVNMFVRKSTFKKLGGFQIGLWPGEDAKLSFQIKDVLKMKQVYIPDLIVYHHRRPLFGPYLNQVWRSGITKGYLIKDFFTIRRIEYFLPSLFAIGLVAGLILSFFNSVLAIVYFSIVGLYVLGALLTGVRTGKLKLGAAVFFGILLTHVTYGIAFLVGWMGRRSL